MSESIERPASPTGSTRSARWEGIKNRLRVGGSSLDDEELATRYSYELEFGSADQFYVDFKPKKVHECEHWPDDQIFVLNAVNGMLIALQCTDIFCATAHLQVTIEDVVHNEKVLEALRDFSMSEHTEENLCFLHDGVCTCDTPAGWWGGPIIVSPFAVIMYKKAPTTDVKQQIIKHYFAVCRSQCV